MSRRRGAWTRVSRDHGQPAAFLEEEDDGAWRVIMAGKDVDVFASEVAAREFVGKIRATPTPSPAKVRKETG